MVFFNIGRFSVLPKLSVSFIALPSRLCGKGEESEGQLRETTSEREKILGEQVA